jgi:hypothetical protein
MCEDALFHVILATVMFGCCGIAVAILRFWESALQYTARSISPLPLWIGAAIDRIAGARCWSVTAHSRARTSHNVAATSSWVGCQVGSTLD